MDREAIPHAPDPRDITELLGAHRAGDQEALQALAPIVYGELHRIAHRQLGRERQGQTIQTTGLVHEAFAKFVELDRLELNDRGHFFALSARLMRQILTDYAKKRQAIKRQGVRVSLRDDDPGAASGDDVAG